MALSVIPPTEAFAYEDATPSPFDRAQKRSRDAHLGRGVIRPFRRAQNDFANAEGVELVRACVGQVLGMRASSPAGAGELPWDPNRGSMLYRLRHLSDPMLINELGRVYVTTALRKYEPRVIVRAVRVRRQGLPGRSGDTTLVVDLRYDIIKTNVPGNQVYLQDVRQTVELA